jgi:hypothetical protein
MVANQPQEIWYRNLALEEFDVSRGIVKVVENAKNRSRIASNEPQ